MAEAAHKRPVVGVTSGFIQWQVPGGRGEASVIPAHIAASHVCSALASAGALPVILPSAPELAEEALEAFDGLVLSGGMDINPDLYGTERSDLALEVDERRDRFELELLRSARSRGTPVLGICRGMEIMAVAAGGSLAVDLASKRPGEVSHWQETPGDQVQHPLKLSTSSRLAAIYGAATIEVNSIHHQGVIDPGDLTISARAPDGLAEALECDNPWMVGVQWHPEYLIRTRPETLRLFTSFVDRAASPSIEHKPRSGAP